MGRQKRRKRRKRRERPILTINLVTFPVESCEMEMEMEMEMGEDDGDARCEMHDGESPG